MKNKVEFLFVVDPPNLIIESILLILSIRTHIKDCDITACVPSGKSTLLPRQFNNFAKKNKVKIIEFQNSPFIEKYPHGNKILALCARDRMGGVIFIDTDTVVYKEFEPNQLIKKNSISVCPEGRRTWGKKKFSQNWGDVYSMFGMPYPTKTVKMVRTNALSEPYYNAGVIAFNDSDSKKEKFSHIWLETALRIDENEKIATKRPWLDQISLPISIERAGLEVNELDEAWNFSLSRKHETNEEIIRINSADPYIIHYHHEKFFEGTKFSEYLNSLISEHTVFDTYSQLTAGIYKRSVAMEAIESQLREIRSKSKEDRTLEDIKNLNALRKNKELEKSKPFEQVFSEWPDIITKRS